MIRVGQGLDVHPFDESRKLILGGISIPNAIGLQGHSDADAVLHALTDAILGAIGAGDIGSYFPSSDERWRNVSSSAFIHKAMELLEQSDGHVVNADITIIAQKPKLAAYRDAMEASIAKMIKAPAGHINVKATTTDHLGFVGREEGICVLAIVLIETGSR
jgi:2-C-methyl-D-erythritol 2,4-cyclodiphosphate synthase